MFCDICGRAPAATWLVGTPDDQKARVDLCTRCDDPARKMFVAGRRTQNGPQGAETIELTEDYSPPPLPTKPVDIKEPEPVYQWTAAREKAEGGKKSG